MALVPKSSTKGQRSRQHRTSAQQVREVRRLEEADRRWGAVLDAALAKSDKAYRSGPRGVGLLG